MRHPDNSISCKSPERGYERRYAYAFTRGVFLADSTRFTIMDQSSHVLGGVDEATATYERDPRETHPQLFVSSGPYGALFDLKHGPDDSYFDRLEALAAIANDPFHARRALNIDGSRQ